MKLKNKPVVYSRINLLLRYSDEFRDYISVPGTTGVNISEELKSIRRDTEKVIDYFSLAENEVQMNIAKNYLDRFDPTAWLIFLFREAIGKDAMPILTGAADVVYDHKDDAIVIRIKAPVKKTEFTSLWDEVFPLQLYFLRGFSDENKVGNKENRECYKELNRLYKKHIDAASQLSKEEFEESDSIGLATALMEHDCYNVALYTEDIWKKNLKEQLDEDLLILRLTRKYRKKKAESEYKKIKLLLFLRKKNIKVDVADETEDFQPLCYKYYPSLTKSSDAVITKTLRLKPFEQRVQKTKEAWGFAA